MVTDRTARQERQRGWARQGVLLGRASSEMRLMLLALAVLGLLFIFVWSSDSTGENERHHGLSNIGSGQGRGREARRVGRPPANNGGSERCVVGRPEVDTRSTTDERAHATGVAEVPELSRIHVHHSAGLVNAAVSAATEVAATLGEEGTIGLWDLRERKFLRMIEPEEPSGQAICFAQQGRVLLQACRDGSVALWDTESGERVGTFGGHRREVRSMSCSISGLIASVSVDDTLVVWEARPIGELWRRGSEERVYSYGNVMLEVVFTFDGARLFGLSKHGVMTWSARDGRGGDVLDTLGVPGTTIQPLAFSPQGGAWALFAARPPADPEAQPGSLSIGAEWPPRATLGLHAHRRICALGFSNDGMLLATGAVDGSVDVWEHIEQWETEACGIAKTYRFHDERILCVAFLAGTRLVSISSDNLICIVNKLR